MADTSSYLTFAENDFLFFEKSYEVGNLGTPLTAMGQNLCERYLKHIIAEYAVTDSRDSEHEKSLILKAHNLRKLAGYIEETMGIEIPDDVLDDIYAADGYYINTRYPGNDSFIPTDRDMQRVRQSVHTTRKYVLDLVYEIENGYDDPEESEGTSACQDSDDEPDL